MFRTIAGLLCVALLLACAPRRTTIASLDDGPTDQWSRGVWLYGQHCAGCHGEHGEGDEDAPALVGDAALKPGGEAEGFATAADVFRYAQQHMPPMSPGSLAEPEYWAVVRYVLDMGERDVGELDAKRAAQVKLR
jgi:mono/diheme cytochrome c family protein